MKLSLPLIAALSAAELKRIPEAEFQRAVIEHARSRGWKVHFTHYGATRLQSGRWVGTAQDAWPDLYLCRGSHGYAWELKREGGKADKAQLEWLEALELSGVTTAIFRPRDTRTIMEMLK